MCKVEVDREENGGMPFVQLCKDECLIRDRGIEGFRKQTESKYNDKENSVKQNDNYNIIGISPYIINSIGKPLYTESKYSDEKINYGLFSQKNKQLESA
ncbi:MAG: hypothetical protein Q7S27_05450 [Nanoarchaeota archaeon]|nr:hypothetical protein [Nanoarchaeota archaeon]